MGAAVAMDKIIADALGGGDRDGSHSFALDLAAQYATPYLREVLLERARNGGSAVLRVHAAALSLYLAGQGQGPFDWAQRPFFLQFGEEARPCASAPMRSCAGGSGIKANTGHD